jgi:ribosomal protein S27AE
MATRWLLDNTEPFPGNETCTKCSNTGLMMRDHGSLRWVPCSQCALPNWETKPRTSEVCPGCVGWGTRNWTQLKDNNLTYYTWIHTVGEQIGWGTWTCPMCGGEGTLAAAVALKLQCGGD